VSQQKITVNGSEITYVRDEGLVKPTSHNANVYYSILDNAPKSVPDTDVIQGVIFVKDKHHMISLCVYRNTNNNRIPAPKRSKLDHDSVPEDSLVNITADVASLRHAVKELTDQNRQLQVARSDYLSTISTNIYFAS
jgi:hypothetical protein